MTRAGRPRTRPAPVQGLVMLTGLAFLVLGAAGLVPGVTTDGQLFGVFAVSGALTLLHLLTGAIAVFCTRSAALSRRFLVAAGLLYAALGVYGLLPGLRRECADVHAGHRGTKEARGPGLVRASADDGQANPDRRRIAAQPGACAPRPRCGPSGKIGGRIAVSSPGCGARPGAVPARTLSPGACVRRRRPRKAGCRRAGPRPTFPWAARSPVSRRHCAAG